MSSATTATTTTSSYNSVVKMMNIEKFINDTDIRHQKLLQNIVNILKINDLLEEYRQSIRSLQSSCTCRKTRTIWEKVHSLESKYKELIRESCRNSGGGSTTVTPITTTLTLSGYVPSNNINNNNNNNNNSSSITANNSNYAHRVISAKVVPHTSTSTPNTATPITSTNSMLNFSFFNSSLCSNNVTNCNEDTDTNFNMAMATHIKEEIVTECSPLKILNDSSSSSFLDHLNNNNNNNSINNNNNNNININNNNNNNHHNADTSISVTINEQPNDNSNPITVTTEDNDDVNLIEEEEILEDEEDDAEEELDIDEYLALLEILEKEGGQNKFEKDEDPDNEYILAIRNINSQEIICYECIVGGSCGFLSRERARMLLHVSKHFQGQDDQCQLTVNNNKRIDISIIPLSADSTSSNTGSSVTKEFRKSSNNLTNRYVSFKSFNPKTLKTKVGEKPIHCEWDNCTFMCDQNYKLRTHIRQVHEKVRPYLCDWPGCFGAYKTRSNLASHRMVHTGERPFLCDFPKCGAKFARKYDCERHRRIHSEKMYACEWPGCGKRLCDPYNLERHMMVHKGELPFRCPISNCVRGFRELRYLRDHMVNCHKFLPDTNQLRLACLNSSKLVSISGYDLNESNSDASTNDAVATAFVTAIVSQGNLKRTEPSVSVTEVSITATNDDSNTIEEDNSNSNSNGGKSGNGQGNCANKPDNSSARAGEESSVGVAKSANDTCSIPATSQPTKRLRRSRI